jgi:single-strand DNA-binding protein
MAADLNSVTLVGRLAKDPDLRTLPSGMAVCELRLAFTSSKKGSGGAWEDVSNFVNVTVWGAQGEAAARNLAKGKRIGVNGRLEHRQWKAQDGSNREGYSIVANSIQYLTPKDEGSSQGGGYQGQTSGPPPAQPAYTPAPADDDIPF